MVRHGGTLHVVAGSVHYRGTVRVMAVNPLSCATRAHSAWHGLRPGIYDPRGNIVVPTCEHGIHPLLADGLPGHGGIDPNHLWLGRGSFGLAGSMGSIV